MWERDALGDLGRLENAFGSAAVAMLDAGFQYRDLFPRKVFDPPRCPESSSVGKDGQVGSKPSRRYPEELKAQAVQMVADVRSETVSEWEAMGG